MGRLWSDLGPIKMLIKSSKKYFLGETVLIDVFHFSSNIFASRPLLWDGSSAKRIVQNARSSEIAARFFWTEPGREGCHHLLSWQMKRSKWEKQVGTLCNCIVDHGDWAFFGVFWYLICIYLYVGSIWRTLLYWRPHYPILNALFTSFYYWMHYPVNFSSTLGLLLTVFLCWMLCWQFYFKIHNAALEVCHHSSLNLLLPSQSWLNVFLLYSALCAFCKVRWRCIFLWRCIWYNKKKGWKQGHIHGRRGGYSGIFWGKSRI